MSNSPTTTRVGRLTTSIRIRDTTEGSKARRLVDSCIRHEFGFDLPRPDFTAIRRLNVRLKSQHGLPTRRALGQAWKAAIEQAIAAQLEQAQPGVGENVVVFRSDHQAQRAWLRSWTSRTDRPWWTAAVAATLGTDDPIEPASVLLHWAEHRPELLAQDLLSLPASHPSLDALTADDWTLVWRTYEHALGSARMRSPGVERRRPSTASRQTVAALRSELLRRGISVVDSPHSTVVARLLTRVIAPDVVELDAIDELIKSALRPEPPVPDQRSANPDEAATEREAGRVDAVAGTTAGPGRGGDSYEPTLLEGLDVAAEVEFDNAGLTFLWHPLFAEAIRRADEGEVFTHVWTRLLHAAFHVIHGPRPEHLRYALERESELFWWWFAVRTNSDWVGDPDDDARDFIVGVGEALPVEWGEDGIARLMRLVQRRARVHADLPYVNTTFTLDQSDIEVRRRGWDIDPGWVPDINRVLRFHYEELS